MSSGHNTEERDPFAPPPEGAPDRPWGPRTGNSDQQQQPAAGGEQGEPGESADPGERPQDTPPRSRPGNAARPARPPVRPGQGSQQPGGGLPPGTRFDPADPVQRHARYALLAGLWGIFFAFFGLSELSLLLGSLALYWGISSLRGQRRARNGGGTPTAATAAAATVSGARPASGAARPAATPPPPPPPLATGGVRPAPNNPSQSRPQATAALSGVIAGGAALALVLSTFVVQLVYKPYFDCAADALTNTAKHSCSTLLPEPLHDLFGVKEK
jgi:hypothetical protein